MFLLTAPIVKSTHYVGWNLLYLSLKTSNTKLESHSIPNLDLSEKSGKAVIK